MASTSNAGSDEEYTRETRLSSFTRTIGFIGLAAAVPWTLSCMTLKHRASIRICTATAATCGVLGSLTYGISSSHSQSYRAAVKNTSSERQPHRETQRYPGLRDGVILGGLASILMLSRLPARARIYRRTLVASTCGVAAAYTAYRISEARDEMQLARVLKPAVGLESTSFAELSATIKAILSMVADDHMLQPTDGIMAASRGPLVDQGDSVTSDSCSSGRGTSPDGASQTQGNLKKDDPSTVPKPPYKLGVTISVSTNYQWKSQNPITDLEENVKQLTERREQLAREAEILWSWLSVKELEYYNHYSKLAESSEKRSKRYYLHTLGQVHFLLWQEAIAMDWQIADDKKRMLRLRSMDANGDMTWCIQEPATAALSQPKRAMLHFQNFERKLAKIQAQVQQDRSRMAEILWGFDEDAQNEQIYHPKKKKMVSQKEMFAEARVGLAREVERIDESQRAIKQVIVDAKKPVNE
ncbi:hypothetical protein CBER1_05329 [Cercospora berteroae]|uniref:Uncharacterized protein n=1 Tax=Cercospora berteroae TaxID=357750 RepID=A0A2S6CHP9_9PEZI|nr:hypothetical protein CBER1_05329 [Cercospora berteroae]